MRPGSLLLVGILLAAGQNPTFRTRTDVVTVDALATEGNRPIGGLTAADFDLLDNGVRQRIDDFSIQDVPISMLLVLDTSSSVEGSSLRDLQDAARSAIATLHPDDRASLVTFSEALGGAPAWTAQQPALRAAIDATTARGATGLYDAAFAALMHVYDEPGRRRLIVLFTDGHDTTSWLPPATVLDAASRTDAVVYVVTLEPPRPDRFLIQRSGITLTWGAPVLDMTPFLPELVARTGGDLFLERGSGSLRRAFDRIVTEFRTRYLLRYSPENVAPGGWHSIDVKLKGRKGSVKARRGYQR